MKKIASVMLVVAGLGASFAATAAETIGGDPISNAECALLGETVRLNLSTNVHGAYSCDETTNTIKVAACHKAGSRKAGVVACQQVDEDPNGDPIYNDTSCDGTAGQTFDMGPNYRFYAASSRGGSVGAFDLGPGTGCDDDTVTGVDYLD